MARAAKKDLSIQPIMDSPFQIPVNWQWVPLGILNKYDSESIDPSKQPDTTFELYSVPSSADNYPEVLSGNEIGSTKQKVEKGDVLLCKINPRINRVWIVSQHTEYTLLASSEWIIIRNQQINPEYLMYCLRSPYFRELMLSNVSGVGGSLMRAQPKYVKDYPIPIPPINEQQRIVAHIKNLFAKLDEVKEKAQAVVDGFEDRKAAILHKAFTGELTKQWRSDHGTSKTSWRSVTVKDVCHDIKVGIVIKPSQYYTDKENGTPSFRSANVREFHIDDFDWVYLNELGMEANQRSIVHTGDVLVVRSGNPGTACVVDDRYNGYNAIDILIAVPNQALISPNFLCAFTNSPIGRNLVAENKRGMALAHFNVSGYSKLNLKLPSLQEQEEITGMLFRLLEKEQQSKEIAEQIIDQIETMKKSILARAFRGELGTNDPNDESAEDLLKRIL